jgi:hypothetical protein
MMPTFLNEGGHQKLAGSVSGNAIRTSIRYMPGKQGTSPERHVPFQNYQGIFYRYG